jgi:hypothetical protein
MKQHAAAAKAPAKRAPKASDLPPVPPGRARQLASLGLDEGLLEAQLVESQNSLSLALSLTNSDILGQNEQTVHKTMEEKEAKEVKEMKSCEKERDSDSSPPPCSAPGVVDLGEGSQETKQVGVGEKGSNVSTSRTSVCLSSLSHVSSSGQGAAPETVRPVLARSALPQLSEDLLNICRLDTPMLRRIPRRASSAFAKKWADLLQEAMLVRTEITWARFLQFPKAVLLAPSRGGKRISRKANMGDVVLARIEAWTASFEELWSAVKSRSGQREFKRAPAASQPSAVEDQAVRFLRMGDVKKALQSLNAAPIAPKTEATFNLLQALHPPGPPPPPVPPAGPPLFTQDTVSAALATFGNGSAAGLFGYTPFLLKQCMQAESFNFGRALTSAVNMLADGRGPEFLRPFLAGGVSIALSKGNNAVRPLCSGDPLRRLVGKCFCMAGKTDISKAFKGRNYGVGCPGGVEVVAHSLRDTLAAHAGSDLALLKIDFKNAFNLVDREAFMRTSCAVLPGLSNWTNWCYEAPSVLLYDHKHIMWSKAGVQQGDPLGPLYFCFGLAPLVEEIAKLGPVYQKWYMDDGGIVGSVDLLLKVWDILKVKGPALGLHLNPAKCEWSWLNASNESPCPIPGVPCVPTDEICMLGVPLGSKAFSSSFVQKKLFDRLRKTVQRLEDFQDSQSAMFLLRVSYSIVRAVHFMRTTPLDHWIGQSTEFDNMIREAAECILGFPMSNDQYVQACLTPTLGGLGLRRTQDHARAAYAASFTEAMGIAEEKWVAPPDVVHHFAGNQRAASFAIDERVHKDLVSRAPSARERQRLRRITEPHAGAFVTAVPSTEDGEDTVMKPQVYRTSVAYRLGVAVTDGSASCPLCKQTIDQFGDHASCCTKSGSNIVRHNRIRNLVERVCQEGLLAPVLEKKGILGPTSGRRPGDITVPLWKNGDGLAIDVAVTSPYSVSNLHRESPCEVYAAQQKHAKYDRSFQGTNYVFGALVMETTGAINEEGQGILRQLFRFAAKRQNQQLCVHRAGLGSLFVQPASLGSAGYPHPHRRP